MSCSAPIYIHGKQNVSPAPEQIAGDSLMGAAQDELLTFLSLHGDCSSAPKLPGHSWGLSHCCKDYSIPQQHFTWPYFKIKNKLRNKRSYQTWGQFFCCLIPAGKTPVNTLTATSPTPVCFMYVKLLPKGLCQDQNKIPGDSFPETRSLP